MTDMLFGVPSDMLAKLHSSLAPTYMYVCDYVSSSTSDVIPPWMGNRQIIYNNSKLAIFGYYPQTETHPHLHLL